MSIGTLQTKIYGANLIQKPSIVPKQPSKVNYTLRGLVSEKYNTPYNIEKDSYYLPII